MSCQGELGNCLPQTIKAKLFKIVKQRTNFYDVADPYNVLQKLEVQVTPQTEKVDFYGGQGIPHYDYDPLTSGTWRRLEEERKSNQRQLVELPGLFDEFHSGQITFTGTAGCGKTTILRSIARDAIDGEYKNLKDLEIIVFMECKDISNKKELTPGELLFGNLDLTEEEIEICLDFATRNPHKILFIIDSLDTLPYALQADYGSVSIHGRASPMAILSSLLSGKLFPNCRIITSSREHAIRDYKSDLRADLVIAMVGLTKESMKKIICGYLGEKECDKTMLYLETKSPLMSLCSTPVFLVFTLIGLKTKGKFIPSTMSGIMVRLLQSLLHSEHTRQENIEDVLNKLKILSFNCTKDHRVLFTIDELEKLNLTAEEVADLAVLAPGGHNKKILENHNQVMFFSHQSIQETLTALYIAEMDLNEFTHFLKESIHSSHYAVIRRILCGILLDDNILQSMHQLHDDNLEAKQALLKKSLVEQLTAVKYEADLLEIFISMHEAQEGMKKEAKQHVHDIILHRIPISPSDAHAVGSVVTSCDQLGMLMMMNCNLNSTSISAMAEPMKSSHMQISDLILGENPNLGKLGASIVGETVQKCGVKSVDLRHSNLKFEDMKEFKKSVQSSRIKTFQLDGNTEMDMSEVGNIIQQCHVKELSLQDCGLQSDDMNDFLHSVYPAKISTLDICRNPLIGPGGMHSVGDIVEQCQIKAISLRYCKLTWEHLEALKMALKSSKIFALDVGGNLGIDVRGIPILCQIVRNCQVKQLDIACVVVTLEDLQTLKICLQDTEDFKIEEKIPNTSIMLSLIDLISHVTEELWIEGWHIAGENREMLQTALNQHGNLKLKIVIASDDVMTCQAQQAAPIADETDLAKEAEIGPQGGDVELGLCQVIFPPRAVRTLTLFKIWLHVKWIKLPNGYIRATPTLTCTPSMKFDRAVKVQLPTWYSTESDDVVVEIMVQDDDTTQNLCKIPLKTADNMIEFECFHFTSFWGRIKRWIWGALSYHISAYVYSDGSGNFIVALHARDETVKRKCKAEMKEFQCELTPAAFNPLTIKEGNHIEVSLECQNQEGYHFLPGNRQEHEVEETFEDDLHIYLQFAIDPRPQPNQAYRFLCTINQRQRSTFNITWPEIVIHGDVHTLNVFPGVRDVRLLQEQNADEDVD